MIKRFTLFALTNILVIAMVSIVLNVLGIGGYVEAGGINHTSLMLYCLLWGMVGSIISLAISRMTAKWMMGVKIIDPNTTGEHDWVLRKTHEISKSAGLNKMPEVGIYNSPDVNAFATGPTKNRALVAVSTGLLSSMNKDEAEGVLAHEVAHIANGDMVTMTLIQGVINAFVMFFARIIAFTISQKVDRRMSGIVHFVTIMALQIAFGVLGTIVTSWFSRKREFRADSGSAKYVGRDKMISALRALERIKGKVQIPEQKEAMAALQISNNSAKSNFMMMLSTHPSLDKRIKALETMSH